MDDSLKDKKEKVKVADIVFKKAEKAETAPSPKREAEEKFFKSLEPKSDAVESVPTSSQTAQPPAPENQPLFIPQNIFPPKIKKELENVEKEAETFEKGEENRFGREELKIKRKPIWIKLAVWLGLLLLAVGLLYTAVEILPTVKIGLTVKKYEFSFLDSITASANVSATDLDQKIVPAEIFSQIQNKVFFFPATAKKQVSEKAKGKITIYNIYSSKPQTLVAGTRFAASDNKIFRLDKGMIVPGAEIVGGKISSSKIEASVTADKPGSEYNIDPVEKFTIPAFQGTDKYDSIYAKSEKPMTGGFVGERAYPSEEDIQKGKEAARSELQSAIDSFLAMQISPGFIYDNIQGSKQFSVLKEEVNPAVNEKNEFSIFLEAKTAVIAFKETDLMKMLENLASGVFEKNLLLHSVQKMEYGVGRFDIQQKKISFAFDFKGLFWKPIKESEFKKEIFKKKENELKNFVYAYPEIERAAISFWPLWVKRVPDDSRKINLIVQ